jgi:hypothetical protein
MAAGRLKMWNADRGFGFFADNDGGPDMFLHINDLKTAGLALIKSRLAMDLHLRRPAPAMEGRKPATFGAHEIGLKAKK